MCWCAWTNHALINNIVKKTNEIKILLVKVDFKAEFLLENISQYI